jgi:hypothetical protein
MPRDRLNPNPLFKRKPGETKSDHLRRLRKDYPDRFGMQLGHKVSKKKFTAADLKGAEKRAEEKVRAEMKLLIEQQQFKKISATEPPPVAGAETKPVPAAPVIIPAAPVSPLPQIVDEREIFSPAPPPPPPGTEQPLPGPEPTPAGASQPAPAPDASGAKYGAMIWTMICKLCVGIFGPGFEPIMVKGPDGTVVYDENAEGIKVWVNYLASIGVKVFSPVVELWIFMGSYLGLRAGLIIQKFRNRKKGGAAAGGQKEPPPTEAKSPAAEKTTEPPPPPPAAAPAAAPASAIGEVDTGQEEI